MKHPLEFDITDPWAPEESLLPEGSLIGGFKAAPSHSPVVLVDADLQIIYLSPSAESMFRCSAESSIGRSMNCLLTRRSFRSLQESIHSSSRSGSNAPEVPSVGHLIGKRSTGQEFAMETSLSQLRQNGSKVFCLKLDEVDAPVSSPDQQTWLEAALACVTEAVVVSDPAGTIQYFNAAFRRILGYTSEEVLGRPLGSLLENSVETTGQPEVWRTVLKGGSWSGPLRARRKDASWATVEVIFSLLDDLAGGAVCLVGTFRESSAAGTAPEPLKVTVEEHRELTDKIKELENRLRQSQKMAAIGQLAGGAVHDFNNLLIAVIGYSEIALAALGQNHPLRSDILEIHKAGQRATTLARHILAYSRQRTLTPQVLSLNRVLSGMEGLLRRQLGSHRQLVILEDPQLAKIRADLGQIEQVIMNLVLNSRDAMAHEGTLTIKTANVNLEKVRANASHEERPGPYVLLTVTDTGSGISPATRSHLFDPFFTTKEAAKGNGLGLSTVKAIVKQSSGFIRVSSKVGRGTTFSIFLPQALSGTEAPRPAKPDRKAVGGSETILIAEDDDAVRSLICQVLRNNGYTALEAKTSPSVRELCQKHPKPIHLLIADTITPGTSGQTLAQQMAVLRPEMKTLLISGRGDSPASKGSSKAANKGLRGYQATLEKPFTPAALVQKVFDMLHER